jgi:hypothetical protein
MATYHLLFQENLEEELVIRIKELPIKERLKIVAIHYHLNRKKKLDE